MKTMSKKDFDRLSKKKGYKIKRKMGAQKKPEPEVKDEVALSGAKATETAVPVPALSPEQPMAAMSASMAARDSQLETVIENNTKAIEKFQAQLARQVVETPKRVSWRHKVKRTDKLLIDEVISTPIT